MSRGITGFEPGRLIQALSARGLSQVALASMVGVSPATVSKWKNGQQSPEAEALTSLSQVINVTPEWFTRPLPEKCSLPLFRSNASAHSDARKMLEARLEWAQDIALALSEFVDFPDVNLPVRSFTDPEQITSADIEEAADECRALWNLGRRAIPDLAMAVEGAGVILVREETGIATIEGLSSWSQALDRPMILLSADKQNGFRSRFDLAHELGHLILHKGIERSTDPVRHKMMEDQAHRFAGAFLLPAETFAADVRSPVTLDSLLLLKQRWGVSVAAMFMRLWALKIIDDETKSLLFKRRSARWGVKAEPGDDGRAPEQTRLLKRTIELLASSGVMPVDAVSSYIGLSATDIEMLSGLPLRYLSGNAAVVHLAKLKNVDAPHAKPASEPGVVVPFTRGR
ncbi:XRE family transcriptional regulator [Pseudomonas syringae]|jgi:Zn-dependent peptidase ImmA (M78 family)/DNA-binding XRE family transcriptional regulator|uniref:XRE family transcriptional regulator n=2 Tax=Pseudomonas fragariae (ex Marin et al. 2024) TaxID=3080056 RepID=A0ABU5B9C1_9PSED|nr:MULTISPECIES: XRE family transcriptional regulator [unclassified Pseudomonas]MCW6058075.1 XRE family transcriptional regulator [Pseudomonas fragi]MDV0428164.1 XRE family transcriptional regulator [Pseudomonas sp. 17]MDX9573876.1 XRE family transcriptional regulator [Pseudomonas sp. 21(2023)]MDX9588136.1 XRE family transcriptional regulator [Pseudomonas sp. 19(2023)]MDX9622345.1 XRE family transcriptional regulator [Pseudomonas sp. 20]